MPPRRPALPPAPDELELTLDAETHAALRTARELVRDSRAQSTQDGYRGDWRRFLAWASRTHPNVSPFPSPPALVWLYIGVLLNRGLSAATITRTAAAIAHHHRLAGLPPPTADPTLRDELAGVRRQPSGDERAKNALTREQCTEILVRLATPATLLEAARPSHLHPGLVHGAASTRGHSVSCS